MPVVRRVSSLAGVLAALFDFPRGRHRSAGSHPAIDVLLLFLCRFQNLCPLAFVRDL